MKLDKPENIFVNYNYKAKPHRMSQISKRGLLKDQLSINIVEERLFRAEMQPSDFPCAIVLVTIF